eukprot:Sdes_comp20752_c0_seq1m16717
MIKGLRSGKKKKLKKLKRKKLLKVFFFYFSLKKNKNHISRSFFMTNSFLPTSEFSEISHEEKNSFEPAKNDFQEVDSKLLTSLATFHLSEGQNFEPQDASTITILTHSSPQPTSAKTPAKFSLTPSSSACSTHPHTSTSRVYKMDPNRFFLRPSEKKSKSCILKSSKAKISKWKFGFAKASLLKTRGIHLFIHPSLQKIPASSSFSTAFFPQTLISPSIASSLLTNNAIIPYCKDTLPQITSVLDRVDICQPTFFEAPALDVDALHGLDSGPQEDGCEQDSSMWHRFKYARWRMWKIQRNVAGNLPADFFPSFAENSLLDFEKSESFAAFHQKNDDLQLKKSTQQNSPPNDC